MSASDHLSGLQFKFTEAVPMTAGVPMLHRDTNHRIAAMSPEGREVGSIEWHPHSGMVENVNVDRDRRRQGMATKLWHEAHATAEQGDLAHPIHSDIQFPDGNSWAAGMDRKDFQARAESQKPAPRKMKTSPSPDQGSLF